MSRRTRATTPWSVVALRLLWAFRLELGMLLGLDVGFHLAKRAFGNGTANLLTYAVIAGLFLHPTSRRFLLRELSLARVRRRFAAGARAGGFDELTPRVFRIDQTASGYTLFVRLPAGSTAADLENAAELIAVSMDAAAVRVARDRSNAALATVSVISRDPLSSPRPIPWALATASRWSLWQPIPIGIDENGTEVTVSLPEHNLLLGGEPGAGKSAAMSLLIAAAALDPSVRLWLFDGKRVELAQWGCCAEKSVGPDLTEAADVIDRLRHRMDERYEQLLASDRRKITRGDGLGLDVVIIDELALYLATGERKLRDRLAEGLRDLVARGRAAGVIVIAATQKPSSDVVPTSVRDLFGFRWALRCATREASDTVLGSGWAAAGHSAADIDPTMRGVGLLLHEGGVPVRMRSAYLDDRAIAGLAARAAELRSGSRQ